MNSRKTKLIIIVALCLVVICLTVGYAILSANLNISGQASVNGGRWDVVFLKNDAKVVGEGRAKCNLGTIENSSIKDLTVSLEEAGDSCTFTIPIQNTGTVEAYLTDVVGKDNSLTFNSTSVSDIEKIKPLVTYEVKYGDMQINSQTDFSKIPVLKADAKETVTLKAMINADDSIGKTNPITIGGFDRTFVFNSNSLEEGSTDSVVPLGSPNKPVLNGDMIPVYYEKTSDTTGNWVKADTTNSDNNWYDYDSQKWANAVTVKNTVKDLSGNNNDGVVHGAVVGNGEASFDGEDDYIDVGLAGHDFRQITYVVKFTLHHYISDHHQIIIGNTENAGASIQLSSDDNKRLLFMVLDNNTGTYLKVSSDASLIDLEKEYIVVGTCDGGSMKLYLNGTLVAENKKSINIRNSISRVLIGADPSDNFGFDSPSNISVNDGLVFDKSLTEEEIKQHYSNEVTLGETKPLVYYNFEDANREYYKEAKAGTTISMDDINTMWVWIPRYSYTIKQPYGKASSENENPTQALPGEIDVKFIPSTITETGSAQYTEASPRNWRTNAAFDFDNKKRAGIWVAKFEPTGTLGSACVNDTCDINTVTIKPSTASIRFQKVSSFFYMARSMQKVDNPYGFSSTSGDLHMIKNDEWGAVAYLSQSKYGKYGNSAYTGANKEIYQNKSSDYITGNSNGTPSISTINTQYTYNNLTNLGTGAGQAGPGASTTGTIYGVYDMSGGAYEYVMAAIAYDNDDLVPMSGNNSTGTSNSGFNGKFNDGTDYNAGIPFPNIKYYTMYKTQNPNSSDFTNSLSACGNSVCYGCALSETKSWYDDVALFVSSYYPWVQRGGYYGDKLDAGIFDAGYGHGGSYNSYSCRLALVS